MSTDALDDSALKAHSLKIEKVLSSQTQSDTNSSDVVWILSVCLSVCLSQILLISTIFRKKTRNSLFPPCKTSIGNNSGSVKDRVVKFAHSMGLSAIADGMVWPPSLSRDRKWPRPPILRRTALWMRLTQVAYKLEQSVRKCASATASTLFLGCEEILKKYFPLFFSKNAKFPIPAMQNVGRQ